MNKKRSAQIESSSCCERHLFRKILLGIHVFKEKKNEFKDNVIEIYLINVKDNTNGYRKSAFL